MNYLLIEHKTGLLVRESEMFIWLVTVNITIVSFPKFMIN